MNENEKAAIVTKLAETCPEHQGDSYCRKLPDMHDPANWTRAIENLGDSLELSRDWHTEGWKCEIYRDYGRANICAYGKTAGDAVFAVSVMLYDAEHPQQKESDSSL